MTSDRNSPWADERTDRREIMWLLTESVPASDSPTGQQTAPRLLARRPKLAARPPR